MSSQRQPHLSQPAVRLASATALLLGLAMLTGVAVSARQQSSQEPAPQQTAPPKDHAEFPVAPGRDTTLRLCSKCHSPNNILATGRTRQGWTDIITKMVDFGAQGSDEEFTQVLDYLTASFPPASTTADAPHINVNKASATELATTLTLTTAEVKALIDYREKNGDFKSLDDLKKVPHIDAKKLDDKKDAITF